MRRYFCLVTGGPMSSSSVGWSRSCYLFSLNTKSKSDFMPTSWRRKRQRIKWRCPMHRDQGECPHKKECSPSPYGRVVYTKLKDDFRLFTQTPRGSKAWKKVYARRTTVERTIKRILVDYLIEICVSGQKNAGFGSLLLQL